MQLFLVIISDKLQNNLIILNFVLTHIHSIQQETRESLSKSTIKKYK